MMRVVTMFVALLIATRFDSTSVRLHCRIPSSPLPRSYMGRRATFWNA